jgi:hypothetical protein
MGVVCCGVLFMAYQRVCQKLCGWSGRTDMCYPCHSTLYKYMFRDAVGRPVAYTLCSVDHINLLNSYHEAVLCILCLFVIILGSSSSIKHSVSCLTPLGEGYLIMLSVSNYISSVVSKGHVSVMH